jgi:hypothetical protein
MVRMDWKERILRNIRGVGTIRLLRMVGLERVDGTERDQRVLGNLWRIGVQWVVWMDRPERVFRHIRTQWNLRVQRMVRMERLVRMVGA